MILIEVKNLQGQVTHGAKLKTQEDVDNWIANQASVGAWGKSSGFYPISKLTPEELAQEISRKTVDDFGNLLTEPLIEIPAQYTIEQTDITSQIVAQDKLLLRAKKRQFGESLIDQISVLNDSKLPTFEQVDALMGNALITSLREHLWSGNIDTFVTKLIASDVSQFFTTDEKNNVITQCQAFFASLS